ncbi:hypothetical protein GGP41_007561 [Bipolaris sorokiniana]|uniref:Uncharacterized protein n=1 Tax=Cochliobolus sativus TaxID=45130 RepID=A0A8H5Z9N9_COCSA|nr:hypothetical protein GGP41_007561 [Bipolaris sorokiniana]
MVAHRPGSASFSPTCASVCAALGPRLPALASLFRLHPALSLSYSRAHSWPSPHHVLESAVSLSLPSLCLSHARVPSLAAAPSGPLDPTSALVIRRPTSSPLLIILTRAHVYFSSDGRFCEPTRASALPHGQSFASCLTSGRRPGTPGSCGWAPVGSARSINRRWARRPGLDDGASGLFLEYWSGAAATTMATHVLVLVLPVDRLMGQNPQTGGRPRTARPSRAASGRVCPSRD